MEELIKKLQEFRMASRKHYDLYLKYEGAAEAIEILIAEKQLKEKEENEKPNNEATELSGEG